VPQWRGKGRIKKREGVSLQKGCTGTGPLKWGWPQASLAGYVPGLSEKLKWVDFKANFAQC